MQRGNGGAGCNSCLCDGNTLTKVYLYEAYFCCTMRLGEGLKEIKDFLVSENDHEVTLNILTPNYSETSHAKIEVSGSIYSGNNEINIHVFDVKEPFILKTYISKELGFTGDFEKKSYNNSLLETKIVEEINIKIKFILVPHTETNVHYVGDCILVKRHEFKSPISFNINNNEYYYLLDYINIKNESDSLSIIQEI